MAMHSRKNNKISKNKQGIEVITFPVPFINDEINDNIAIITKDSYKPTRQEIINQAFKFHAQGDILKAKEYYDYFINQGFTNASVFSNYAVILITLGKLEKAELLTRKAIDLKPDYLDAYLNLVNILRNLGKLEESERFLRKAIEIKPNNSEVYSNLGNIMTDLGKLKESEKFLRKAIEINPHNKKNHNSLISLLTIYQPTEKKSHLLYLINEEFRSISLRKREDNIIKDSEVIKIYKDGLKIYHKYNLDIESSLSQIYKRNDINLNCKRHKLLFNQNKIIPEFCFGCYKVQV